MGFDDLYGEPLQPAPNEFQMFLGYTYSSVSATKLAISPGIRKATDFDSGKVFPDPTEAPWRDMSIPPLGVPKRNRASSRTSPYVILPTDELILGLDAGISCLPLSGTFSGGTPDYPFWEKARSPWASAGLGRANAINSIMSGSFMKMVRGEASITLFGSMIREGVEAPSSLNQNLTSDAIHEMIHETGPYDQFNISSRWELSSSYTDQLIFGRYVPHDTTSVSPFSSSYEGLSDQGNGIVPSWSWIRSGSLESTDSGAHYRGQFIISNIDRAAYGSQGRALKDPTVNKNSNYFNAPNRNDISDFYAKGSVLLPPPAYDEPIPWANQAASFSLWLDKYGMRYWNVDMLQGANMPALSPLQAVAIN